MNTVKSTREKVIQEISEYFSKTGQDYTVKADDIVADAVLISDNIRTVPKMDEITVKDVKEVKGMVVVGEMCGLAVMRGAHVFAPGIDQKIMKFTHENL